MHYVTVLNFATGGVHIYHYTDEELSEFHEDSVEEFITSQGHRIADCQWLCTDTLLLQIH